MLAALSRDEGTLTFPDLADKTYLPLPSMSESQAWAARDRVLTLNPTP